MKIKFRNGSRKIQAPALYTKRFTVSKNLLRCRYTCEGKQKVKNQNAICHAERIFSKMLIHLKTAFNSIEEQKFYFDLQIKSFVLL